jgi:alpha-beta hydrolase superfamily lysophospholipase
MVLTNIITLASSTFVDQILYFPWGRMALIGLFIYLVLSFYAWLFADRILFPAPKEPGYRMDESVFFVECQDGVKIACKYWHNPSADHKTILYSHGNAEDIGRIEESLAHWVETGYSVLAYDYPGYGHSSAKPSEQGCYNAIDAVYEHLKKNLGIPAEQIVIWGRSLGTGPSCYLAEKEKVAGLVLETPFISAFLTVTEIPVVPWDRFPNLKRAPNLSIPTIVIHGHRDEIVPFRHGKRFFEALPEPKTFLQFQNAGHNDLSEIGGDQYREKINDFLSRVLDG